MTSPFGCFRCNDAGHWADACPELIPPASKAECEQRRQRYIEWYVDKRITPQQKQKLITALNEWRKATERKAS